MTTIQTFLLSLFACCSLLADFVFSPAVDSVVSSLDMNAWLRDTGHLASFNRYYRSNDINAVRDWLKQQFDELGLTTSLEEVSIGGYTGYNVVAEIKGTTTPEEIYLVGAHYDTISENPDARAPGAEDNASGTAGLLTLAKAFAHLKPKSTIRFVAFSGEEEGLIGSKHHVENILGQNEQSKIRGVLIMDMIGFTEDTQLDALIETSRENQYLVNLLSASAAKYNHAPIDTSYNYWGSDHVPFIENGFSAALLIENDFEEYPDYHRTSDTVDNLNPEMAKVILSMIAGALGFWVLP